MERGLAMEEEAKGKFQLATGLTLMPVGFVLHPYFDWAGASPDGLLDDATYECKCPTSMAAYTRWIRSKEVPSEHRDQMLWQMRCTGMRKGVFHAFAPQMRDESIRSIVRFLEWDQERIDAIENSAIALNAEIEFLIKDMGLPPTIWDTFTIPLQHKAEVPMSEAEQRRAAEEYIDQIGELTP
jgi:predicted phage-related endonuclease